MDDASDDEIQKRPPSNYNKQHKPANTESLRNVFNRYVSQNDVTNEDAKGEEPKLANGGSATLKEAEPVVSNGHHMDGNMTPVSNGSFSQLNKSDPVYVVNA